MKYKYMDLFGKFIKIKKITNPERYHFDSECYALITKCEFSKFYDRWSMALMIRIVNDSNRYPYRPPIFWSECSWYYCDDIEYFVESPKSIKKFIFEINESYNKFTGD